jgi:hypothetical protein
MKDFMALAATQKTLKTLSESAGLWYKCAAFFPNYAHGIGTRIRVPGMLLLPGRYAAPWWKNPKETR